MREARHKSTDSVGLIYIKFKNRQKWSMAIEIRTLTVCLPPARETDRKGAPEILW